MAQWATDAECRDCLHSVASTVDAHLKAVGGLTATGQIHPTCRIALAEGEGPVSIEATSLRIGVYPIAANPMHWGHVIVALATMEIMKLDKVVFIIAGSDRRKPDMVSPETRHRLGRSVIDTFLPLFAYSPLALGTDLDGETNLGRFMRLNARQPMEAFYIAGSDHYRRLTPGGEPDTVQKLERAVAELEDGRQKISAIFINREDAAQAGGAVSTFLDVHILPPIPMSFSSTAARKALCKDTFCAALVSLPYSCLLEIRKDRVYASRKECMEELGSPP